MDLKAYTIRITTIDNLYADYIVEAENLFFAKMKARNAFFRDYPDADTKIKLSLTEPTKETLKEVIDIIGGKE